MAHGTKARRLPRLAVLAAAAFCTLMPSLMRGSPARAGERDFPYTYDWKQLDRGEKEVEAHSTYLKSDDTFEEELEFERAVGARLSIAPYVVFTRGEGKRLHYNGFQLETRYQLGGYKASRLLSSLYLEYIHPQREHDALESRVILSGYDSRGSDLSFNFVHTRLVRGRPDIGNTCSFGYARPLGKNTYSPRGGVEYIQDLTHGRVNLGPTFAFAPGRGTWLVAGCALPLQGKNNGPNCG